MFSKTILIGRVGQDPEIKEVGDSKVVNLSLATSERWTDKSGERQESTEWHRLQIWGRQAEVVDQYVKKGDLLMVEGKNKTREYEDKEGNTRWITEVRVEVVKLMPKAGGERSDSPRRESRKAEPEHEEGQWKDDLPF